MEKGSQDIYELARRFPNISFQLVGAVSEAAALWEKPDNVELVGGVEHSRVIECLDLADAFIFPSRSEGFSLALAEAMARALPSVVTDVGANADMMDGGCGIVTRAGDVDEMASAIESLGSPEKRREMSFNAVRKVKEHYSADSIIESFKKYYQGV